MLELHGLSHWQPKFERSLLDWRDRELPPPTTGPVRLGNHQPDAVTLFYQSIQCGNSELRCSTKYEIHEPNESLQLKLPLASPGQLADFAPNKIALKPADVGNKKLADEVIGLVHEGPRKKIFPRHFESLSL